MLCIFYHTQKKVLDLQIILIEGMTDPMGEVRALRKSEEQEKDRILGNACRKRGLVKPSNSLTPLTFKLLACKLNLKNLSPVDYS